MRKLVFLVSVAWGVLALGGLSPAQRGGDPRPDPSQLHRADGRRRRSRCRAALAVAARRGAAAREQHHLRRDGSRRVIASGGQSIGLDPALSNPGAGVLVAVGELPDPEPLPAPRRRRQLVFDLSGAERDRQLRRAAGLSVAPCLGDQLRRRYRRAAGRRPRRRSYAVPEPAPLALVALGLLRLWPPRGAARAAGDAMKRRRTLASLLCGVGAPAWPPRHVQPAAGLVIAGVRARPRLRRGPHARLRRSGRDASRRARRDRAARRRRRPQPGRLRAHPLRQRHAARRRARS